MKEQPLRDQMNIVIVGHVDHGKSTLIGRLLADTGSLPEGRLEQARQNCDRNAKPFEYAFLLDALKDEQAQGITIDSARCFFKTKKRDYIIIDAPGHIEFLKNMITGAARAEAALLVIDAHEGVQENSRRHGFMLSLLGIRQVIVLVNKMDLVGYEAEAFNRIRKEFQSFLDQFQVKPIAYIPIAAREGDNLLRGTSRMPWYHGPSVLQLIDSLQKEKRKEDQPFRCPVQDIYKFTEDGDQRRIIAGTVETGKIHTGDEVVFLPSGKRTFIKSIEGFNEPFQTEINAGCPAGFTVSTQIYIKPGEMMCRTGDSLPHVGNRFRANLFWLGRRPMIPGKRYKLKIATNRAAVYLREITRVLDASDLTTLPNPERIDRHDVAECILQTAKPIAFDLSHDIEGTSRFVIIDDCEIVGGGIITEKLTTESIRMIEPGIQKELGWEKSAVSLDERILRFRHQPRFIVVTGGESGDARVVSRMLEQTLFSEGRNIYYLGLACLSEGLTLEREDDREISIRRLGEISRQFIESGMIVVTAIPDLNDFEADILKRMNEPFEILFVVLSEKSLTGVGIMLQIPAGETFEEVISFIKNALRFNDISVRDFG